MLVVALQWGRCCSLRTLHGLLPASTPVLLVVLLGEAEVPAIGAYLDFGMHCKDKRTDRRNLGSIPFIDMYRCLAGFLIPLR